MLSDGCGRREGWRWFRVDQLPCRQASTIVYVWLSRCASHVVWSNGCHSETMASETLRSQGPVSQCHHYPVVHRPRKMGPPLPERLRGTTATLGALSIVTTILRCYVRVKVIKKWGWDDTFIILAFVSIQVIVPTREALLTRCTDHTHVVHRHTPHWYTLWHRPTNGGHLCRGLSPRHALLVALLPGLRFDYHICQTLSWLLFPSPDISHHVAPHRYNCHHYSRCTNWRCLLHTFPIPVRPCGFLLDAHAGRH